MTVRFYLKICKKQVLVIRFCVIDEVDDNDRGIVIKCTLSVYIRVTNITSPKELYENSDKEGLRYHEETHIL